MLLIVLFHDKYISIYRIKKLVELLEPNYSKAEQIHQGISTKHVNIMTRTSECMISLGRSCELFLGWDIS